ncbi:MAG TPA: rhomboid family intramembrane serine protease [Anaerolineaceae bacterium]
MNGPSQQNQPGSYPPNPPGSTSIPGSGQMVSVPMPVVRPALTYILVGLTVLIFLGQEYGKYILGNDFLLNLGAKYTPAILAGEYWRLITPVFLHANELHIAFNMYALIVLGPGLERQYGHVRFLALYFISGFAGNVFSFFFSPGVSVGASTAIFGLIAAEGIFVYQNRKLFGKRAGAVLRNIITIATINLIIGLSPGIDNWGHLGGLAGGLLFAWFAGPIWDVEGLYPNIKLVDKREPIQVQLSAVLVAALFAFLAYLRIRRG